MLNNTVTTVTTRKLKLHNLNSKLTNRIFEESLVDGLKPYNALVNIEYTAQNVPQTGKGIYKMWILALAKIETFKVYNEANDAENLFFTPETNLLYRTLHDIDHANNYLKGLGTTAKKSELYLNCKMAKRAYDYAIKSGYTLAQALETFFTVYHDNVGQVHYYFNNNAFCTNQKALTNELLNNCKGINYLKSGLVSSAYNMMNNYMLECGL